jgi:Tol biopolymer transport system component
MHLNCPILMAFFVLTSAATAGPTNLALVGAPKLSALETVSPEGSDASPAFTPDGRTVFFTHGHSVMVSHLANGAWSQPEMASFSGVWRDIEPAMAPDGSYLVFISNRPEKVGGQALTGFWGGLPRPGAGGNIWRVNREGKTWGKPIRLPSIINSNTAIYSPAVAQDGSIYFNQPDPGTKRSHIYRAQATSHGFAAPVALSISDATIAGYDAAIAPDESFIVFSSNRPPAASGKSLLFVAFAIDGHWTEPKALQPLTEGLEARFSADLKFLYFSADVPSSVSPGLNEQPTPSRIFEVPIHIDKRNVIGSS